jgi:DNA end-binding protein Ku
MQDKEVVGIGRVVLARRERPIMLEPCGKVIRAVTLHHAPEVRHAAVYFADTPDIKLPAEMKELAEVIIDRKTGHFDPAKFRIVTRIDAIPPAQRKDESNHAQENPAAPSMARGGEAHRRWSKIEFRLRLPIAVSP